MHVIGVDPGISEHALGAVASIVNQELHCVHDIPVARNNSKGRFKNWLDSVEFFRIMWEIRQQVKERWPKEVRSMVMIEKPIPMPKQFVQITASSFDTFGNIRGISAAMGLEVEYETPVVWKRTYGLTSFPDGYTDAMVKRASIDTALKFFPLAPIEMAKHHGRAEAILIARHALQKFG